MTEQTPVTLDVILFTIANVTHRVVYSPSGIAHLQAIGQFPPHLKLGAWRNAWRASDVRAWMQATADLRSALNPAAGAVTISLDDRFISRAEVCRLVQLGREAVRKLEINGRFPLRFALGPSRVGWLEREVLDWIKNQPLRSVTTVASFKEARHDARL